MKSEMSHQKLRNIMANRKFSLSRLIFYLIKYISHFFINIFAVFTLLSYLWLYFVFLFLIFIPHFLLHFLYYFKLCFIGIYVDFFFCKFVFVSLVLLYNFGSYIFFFSFANLFKYFILYGIELKIDLTISLFHHIYLLQFIANFKMFHLFS